MRATFLLIATAAALCGCSARAARDPAPVTSAPVAQATTANLEGTEWRFVEVAGAAVPAGVTATLSLHDGRASGKAGCNAYGASWEMSPDGSTKFGAAMSTKMACLTPTGAMQVERGVFAALRAAARIQRNGDSLVLVDASGKLLAKLARAGAP